MLLECQRMNFKMYNIQGKQISWILLGILLGIIFIKTTKLILSLLLPINSLLYSIILIIIYLLIIIILLIIRNKLLKQ